MTTKTKTFVVLLATLLLGAIAGALTTATIQRNKEASFRRMPRNERFYRAMERIIQPTEEQKAVLDKKLAQRFEQIAALRERYESEIFAVYDSLKNDVDNILTAEQQARLQQEIARGPRRMLEDRMAYITEELNLTNEQAKKIKAILQEMVPKPDFRRGERPNRENIRQRIEKMRAEIEAVLTPEQLAKYHESRSMTRMFFDRRLGPGPGPDFGHGPPMDEPRSEPPPNK